MTEPLFSLEATRPECPQCEKEFSGSGPSCNECQMTFCSETCRAEFHADIPEVGAHEFDAPFCEHHQDYVKAAQMTWCPGCPGPICVDCLRDDHNHRAP